MNFYKLYSKREKLKFSYLVLNKANWSYMNGCETCMFKFTYVEKFKNATPTCKAKVFSD